MADAFQQLSYNLHVPTWQIARMLKKAISVSRTESRVFSQVSGVPVTEVRDTVSISSLCTARKRRFRRRELVRDAEEYVNDLIEGL